MKKKTKGGRKKPLKYTHLLSRNHQPWWFPFHPFPLLVALSCVCAIIPFHVYAPDQVSYPLQQKRALQPEVLVFAAVNDTQQSTPRPVRNRHNRTRLHKALYNLTAHELRLEQLSSVDYYACCGLGHRMNKLTDAYFAAKQIGFGLKAFWGFCDEFTEVFTYLFGPQPVEELRHVQSRGRILQLRNEVPGMIPLVRRSNYTFSQNKRKRRKNDDNDSALKNYVCTCRGHNDKIAYDVELYKSLQERFRFRSKVQDFVQKHRFDQHTVWGIHIRGGNGETGDFSRKNRGIANVTEWIGNVSDRLLAHIAAAKPPATKPPLLYVATDTPRFIALLRQSRVGQRVKVLELPEQERAKDGVLFGESGKVVYSGSQCLRGWEHAATDMMILAQADVVVAARPSSFVQSLPHAIALDTAGREYCEMNQPASDMWCYQTFVSWCCDGDTKQILQHIQTFEYLRIPVRNWNLTMVQHKITNRHRKELVLPMQGSNVRHVDLPYSWDKTYKK